MSYHGKKVPTFWWDFYWYQKNGKNTAEFMVQSDDPKFPIIKYLHSYLETEALISDLNAGRQDYRKLAKELPPRPKNEIPGYKYKELTKTEPTEELSEIKEQ